MSQRLALVGDVGVGLGGDRADPGDGRRDALVSVPNALLASTFQLDKLAPGSLVELELSGELADGTRFNARDRVEVR